MGFVDGTEEEEEEEEEEGLRLAATSLVIEESEIESDDCNSVRMPDTHVPTTMSSAPSHSIVVDFLFRKMADMKSTNGMPRRLSNVCVSPGVCGCAMAMQKLAVPFIMPMPIRTQYGHRFLSVVSVEVEVKVGSSVVLEGERQRRYKRINELHRM